jgi:putative addiction module CopG family antidote
MDTINVELSPGQHQFVRAKVTSGHFSSESDYIAALVSDAQRQEAGEKLRTMLQAGEDSGPPVLMTRAEWDKVWQEANEETARRNGHG